MEYQTSDRKVYIAFIVIVYMVKIDTKKKKTISIRIPVKLYDELIIRKAIPNESFSHTISRAMSRSKLYMLNMETKK